MSIDEILNRYLFLVVENKKLKSEVKVRDVLHLLRLGANENAIDDNFSQSPILLIAVKHNEIDVARVLLENGADVKGKARGGQTGLLKAVENGDVKALNLMIEFGDSIKNYDEYLLLNEAINKGYSYMVGRLIELGVDVNKKNGYGFTHLVSAIEKNNRLMFSLLLASGADVNLCREKDSPLMIAVLRGDEYMIKKLIARGANLNSKDKIGRTPLMIGVQRNRVNIVKILLESGDNIKIKDNQGDDVFCYAKDYSNKEMWDVLQEYNKKKKQSVGFNFLGLRERLC